jgi:hypothetical protein
MDAQKIIEVLRATLDANQQQAAHEQLQQVRKVAESAKYRFSYKHMGGLGKFALKIVHIFFVRCTMYAWNEDAAASPPE